MTERLVSGRVWFLIWPTDPVCCVCGAVLWIVGPDRRIENALSYPSFSLVLVHVFRRLEAPEDPLSHSVLAPSIPPVPGLLMCQALSETRPTASESARARAPRRPELAPDLLRSRNGFRY